MHLLLHNKCPHGLESPLTPTKSPDLIPGIKAPKFFKMMVGNSISLAKQILVIIAQLGPGCTAAILPIKYKNEGVFSLSGTCPYIPGKDKWSQLVSLSCSLLFNGSVYMRKKRNSK